MAPSVKSAGIPGKTGESRDYPDRDTPYLMMNPVQVTVSREAYEGAADGAPLQQECESREVMREQRQLAGVRYRGDYGTGLGAGEE